MLQRLLLVVVALFAATCMAAVPNIDGCDIFPASFEYNQAIDTADVDYLSDCYISQLTSDAGGTPFLRLDFGIDPEDGYGIPYSFGSPADITIDLSDGYYDESDCYNGGGTLLSPCCSSGSTCTGNWHAPYATEIESQTTADPNPDGGDRHTIYVDSDTCLLYETFATHREGGSTWSAASSAVFDLSDGTFPQRTAGWTSADAAGLPILPGLLRYDEVNAGAITHALRFTADHSQMAYVSPASHLGVNQNPYNLPYGMRLRLRASFNESGYTAQGQVLIQALKTYGMFYADQGSSFYISGTTDVNWDPDFFDEINQNSATRIHISNFEVIEPPTAITYGYSVTLPISTNCNSISSPASRMSSSVMDILH